MLEGMVVLVEVEAKPPVLSDHFSARLMEAASKGRVVWLKRGINGETVCTMLLF